MLFIVLAIPLVLAIIVLHHYDLNAEHQRWHREMAKTVDQAIAELTADFHQTAADTMVFAADSEFRQRLLHNDFTFLASRFEATARFKRYYRQIRYIDKDGLERLRVDTTPTGVERIADGDLQNKADRDYFHEAVGLADGAVRLSRLDLNIEHGRIETPFNPMLRFSSPVFDAAGVRRGIVVINMGVGPLLEQLERLKFSKTGSIKLINSRGSWLAGGDSAMRWGDIIGNDIGFASMYPLVWQKLKKEVDNGPDQRQFGAHMFAYSTLRPVDILRNRTALDDIEISSADPWWIVVGDVGMDEVNAAPLARLLTGILFTGIVLVIWFAALLGIRRYRRAAHEASRRIQQLAKVVEQTSDLVFITDPDGRIEYTNPAFSETTGYPRTEAVGKTPTLINSGQHPPAFYEGLWFAIKQGRQFRDLFINRRRDGSLFYEEKTISPLMDDAGLISSFVSTGKDITDSKVIRLAFHDELTGLVNRVLFMDRLQHALTHATRGDRQLAVLFMDLDRFKAINDSLGHHAGDEILKEFARRISALSRKSDTLGRLGGDEFALLLSDIDGIADAEQVAIKIIAAMGQEWLAEDEVVELGVSIGIALYPTNDVDGEKLIFLADKAMYDAKRRGRNLYTVYAP